MTRNAPLFTVLILTLSSCAISCDNNNSPINSARKESVKDSVFKMMSDISADISNNGPTGWLRHFEDSSSFFMAANGSLTFQNIDSAKSFIQNILVRQIRRITLKWTNVRVDSLSQTLASVGANWQELITNSSNISENYSGYFTSLAEKTQSGWKLRNLHWSSAKQN